MLALAAVPTTLMTTYADVYPSSASGWTDSSNVFSDNGANASATVQPTGYSAVLITKTYGLAVDTDETVGDIELTVEVASISAGLRMEYALTLDGTSPATPYSEQPTGLWGLLAITADQANSANFGVLARARDFGDDGGTVAIDYMSLAVRGVGGVVGRYFQAEEPVNFADAENGGICSVSTVYWPGHAFVRTDHMGDVGQLFLRKDPGEYEPFEYDGRKR